MCRYMRYQDKTMGVRGKFADSTLMGAVAATGLLLAATRDAFAYVDPGTGSMMLQMIGAAVIGVAFYLRSFRSYLAGLFGRRKTSEKKSEEEAQSPNESG